MIRKNFKDETWDVVVVNGRPYMYCDMRIDRDTVPDGLILYEVADGDCDGRFCRVAPRIIVNFLGTLVGKEPLPMEYGTYYCKYDAEYNKRRDVFIETIEKQLDENSITEEEYDRLLENFEENDSPDDEDGWFIELQVDVVEYLKNYDQYLNKIAASE